MFLDFFYKFCLKKYLILDDLSEIWSHCTSDMITLYIRYNHTVHQIWSHCTSDIITLYIKYDHTVHQIWSHCTSDMVTLYIDPHLKCRYSCHILMRLEFSQRVFEKYSKIQFHDNQPGGSRVVPCGQTDGRTDKKNLKIAFPNFEKASYKCVINHQHRTEVLTFFCAIGHPLRIQWKLRTQPQ
jgi:hypothetical protein